MEKQLHQAIHFFKNQQSYDKLFQLFRKKYESLGRVGGTVSVATFSDEDLEVVSRFFGVSREQLRSKGSVSLKQFEQQLEDTRFNKLTLKLLLDTYFETNLISNKQQQLNREANLRVTLKDERKNHPILVEWFDFLLNIHGDGRWILRLAEQDPSYFSNVVSSLANALSSLPTTAERLPMFSQRMTGDPHAFDLDTDLGKMFLHTLAVMSVDKQSDAGVTVPTDTEAINNLLNEYHIYRDDLLNFVTVAGLYAEHKNGVNKVWEAATTENAVQIVPLRELVPLKRAFPATGKKVWIVENSGVCSVLLDNLPKTPLICTNGQFTLASFILLDLLVKEDCHLYYAGDLDPEGLTMAQRLVERYPQHLQLWHMDIEAYEASQPVKKLTDERLNKLTAIRHPELVEVAEKMRTIGKAGYQESLVEQMIKDIIPMD